MFDYAVKKIDFWVNWLSLKLSWVEGEVVYVCIHSYKSDLNNKIWV
jgi:hypothetical protein